MKKVLGLDLGTNSIGWALVEQDFENKTGSILGIGSRIIPMDAGEMGKFAGGDPIKTGTAARTDFRSARHRYERNHLRRERLHRVLNVLGFLPEHYANDIDFEKRFGKFKDETETKLVWKKNGKKENGNDKFEFAFQSTFKEMLEEFKKSQPDLLNRKNTKGEDVKISYDWAIYYLRKKALTDKITKEELAWVILNFNQKRGYYQLRGEEEETNKDIKDYVIPLKITKVEKGDVDKKYDKKTWYTFTLSNGWTYSATFTSEPKWLNIEKDFLVTEELDENGNIKIVKDKKSDTTGKERRKITPLPSFDEINLMSKKDQDKIYKKIKARTEVTIENSKQTVGAYIYEALLQNPAQKIRGKLIRTIERKFYKEELKAILEKQIALQPKLFTADLYTACIRELYRNNEAHQLQLSKQDFVHLFLEDIIFYQRPLRSQKSSIGNCSLESRSIKYKTGEAMLAKDGKPLWKIFKTIPKSNPYYQEFRVWQWLYNLKIYTKTGDNDVTAMFLNSTEDFENLFDFLMSKKEVAHKDILKYFSKDLKGKAQTAEIAKYRWNYVYDSEKDESKTYPMNETGCEIRRRLKEVENISTDFLTKEIEYNLWHIIYSVTDKNEFEKALKSFAKRHKIDANSFVENFKKFKPFKSEYGSFSEKAIKKLLPLMRLGKHWKWENIDIKTQTRIDKILSGEFDAAIHSRIREKAINLTDKNHFQGLQLWLASYVVYDRHSEAGNISKWICAEDLKKFLDEFKQHSLRNPIVEQVITETLRVVRDIWNKYGNGAKDFFNEIHIELGREMKNTAEDRKRMTNQISENENTNLRIKALLAELKNDGSIENVRPYSPMQQEILKIYEEYAIASNEKYNASTKEFIAEETPEDILKISKAAQPSKSELTRYKLWLEQKYRSPYTGDMIPLSRLFTSDYEIEHVIPQSRYFDDSFTNKVICEAAVNKLKDNRLSLEFIKAHPGEIVETGLGNKVRIFTEAEYKDFVTKHYEKNRGKRTKLLLEEIPDKMIERQMNDTRYISKYISSVLSNIVREEKNDDGINSKNIVPGNGKITSQLKQDWGLNDVWNELILPRFERMNELTKTTAFTSKNTNNKIIPTVPVELSKGFQKKRIDHRHHALDALVIACATRNHVNLLNNQSAKSDTKRYDLQYKLRNTEKWIDQKGNERDKFTEFKKPWEIFTQDARNELEKIVVSFKQNLRVINKATNTYKVFENEKKIEKKQEGVNWAIRKPMHKDTVSGKVELQRIKVPKGKILTATRKSIDTSFDLKSIESITDTGIQKILKNYLASKDGIPELAFSPEGIEDMNRNITKYNDGKPHQPIYKARIFELGSKFPLGQTGNKKDKYVEAAKGTNLFFAVYWDEDKKKRSYETIPFNEIIEHQKWRATLTKEEQKHTPIIPVKPELGIFLFSLSPNDLVYIPKERENTNEESMKPDRIYKVVSFSGNQCFFIKHEVATSIVNKAEYSTLNKMERSIDGQMIKESCIKIEVDRLGNIIALNDRKTPYPVNTNASTVNESTVTYSGSKKVTISKSLEDAENFQLDYLAGLTPEQRFRDFYELMNRFYSFLKPNWPTKKIIIDL